VNDQVTLSTGRVIPLSDVRMEPESQRFYYGVADVTAFLSAAQKRRFPGYDVERANREASDAARIARGEQPYPDPKPVSTIDEFIKGVGSDVAELATDTRDAIGIGAENNGNGSPLLRWALGIGVILLLWKIGALDWVRKKLTA
jgi:hypothetical protein